MSWVIPRGVRWRLFLTVWLVYVVHFTSNVVRETYLAVSLGEHGSVRVDEYFGLHPDLIELPGRGAYIDNNPGASILGAVPYAVANPFLQQLYRWRPQLVAPKPAATYNDPRPNRTAFMNAARARGLDVKLGLAALITQAGLMAPLGAAATVLLYVFLVYRGVAQGRALAWSLLYAFATPMFFRAAFINQNAIIAHLVLAAYVLLVGLRPRPPGAIPFRALVGVGALLGYAVVCDYSGVPLLFVFGVWALWAGATRGGLTGVLRNAAAVALGGVVPLALLLGYQYAAFGNPIWPAQRYMPPTPYSVRGWLGFTLPTRELLLGNLFDPRYGLFAFCPMLIAAFAEPFLRRGSDRAEPGRSELVAIMGGFVALYLFSSANQYANLQWNTGVRYMVPAIPLLFLAAVPVLTRLSRAISIPLIAASCLISWSVSMTRESVPQALAIVFSRGPVLPITTVLEKMRSGYGGLYLGPVAPILVLLALGGVLVVLWRSRPSAPATAPSPEPLTSPH